MTVRRHVKNGKGDAVFNLEAPGRHSFCGVEELEIACNTDFRHVSPAA